MTRTVNSSGQGTGEIGTVTNLGGSGGNAVGYAASLTYEVSNATDLQELAGPFNYFTTSFEFFGGGTITYFWGYSTTPSGNQRLIVGMDFGLSGGFGAGWGYGSSDTRVVQFTHFWNRDPASWFWDWAVPHVALGPIIRGALSIATKHVQNLLQHLLGVSTTSADLCPGGQTPPELA